MTDEEFAALPYGSEGLWRKLMHNARSLATLEEIITATEAIYDAGARTILAWGFHASESNNYRSANPVKSWQMTLEGFRRIKDMERDKILAENRKKFMK